MVDAGRAGKLLPVLRSLLLTALACDLQGDLTTLYSPPPLAGEGEGGG
jgi:hypothetical protein